jgi:hypothetical protein
MTYTQITAILSELGYSTTSDQKLDLKDVAEIVLGSNENVYPDPKTLISFNSNGIMKVYLGTLVSSDTISFPDTPLYCYPISDIEAIQLVAGNRSKVPYAISMSM